VNILFLIGRFPPEDLGGAELQCAALALRLAARGHEVTVLTSRRRRAPEDERRDGYRIVRAPAGRIPLVRFFVSMRSVAAAAARLAPSADVVACFQTFASGYLGVRAARRHRVPCVVWVRGTGEFEGTWRARLFARGVYREADRIFVQSPRLEKALLARHGGLAGPKGPIEAKLRVVPNGVEAAGREPEPSRGADVVFLGRLVADKGVDDLIAAVRAIPGARLTVAGEGPERERLERLAAGAQVRFLGRIEPQAVTETLAGAAVVAHPALRGDGVPNVLLEAMSLGKPVVATRTAGIPDIVRDGVDGILVAPHDVVGLSEALASLLANAERRATLGRSAAQRIRRFAWETVLPQVEDALAEAAGAGRPGSPSTAVPPIRGI